MRRSALACAAVAAATGTLALPAGASAADAILGVTDENVLVQFNSDSPGALASAVPLRGLAANEQAVGLDVRPSNDHVYVTTNQSRTLQVDPTTGELRPVFGPFGPALAGTAFGMDFNPQADALRLVSDTDQNLRITAANVTNADTNLAYAAGDPGAGTNPAVTAVAYSNNVPSAPSTTLYGIDTARDALVRVDPASSGQLRTVGALGTDAEANAGFDIAPAGGAAYATLTSTVEDEAATRLWRIDLANGRATPSGELPELLLPDAIGDLRGIAVAGTVAGDDARPVVSVAFSSTILEQNTDVLEPSVSCDETCAVNIEAQVNGVDAGEATEAIVGAGRATVEIRLSQAARNRIARRGTELISLDITAVDAAGNTTTQNNRVSRTQTLAGRRGG